MQIATLGRPNPLFQGIGSRIDASMIHRSKQDKSDDKERNVWNDRKYVVWSVQVERQIRKSSIVKKSLRVSENDHDKISSLVIHSSHCLNAHT